LDVSPHHIAIYAFSTTTRSAIPQRQRRPARATNYTPVSFLHAWLEPPLTEGVGSPDYDTIALNRVDANTNQATLKKDGKVVQTAKVVLSAGGKVRTLTLTGTTATGQKVNNVMVFDKQ